MVRRPASTTGFILLLLLWLALLFSSIVQAKEEGASKEEQYVPVRKVVTTAAEAYRPFELCKGCRCCAAASNGSQCVDTSCCYAIDCDIPGKPFGVCAFTPRTCGCGANNNCTHPS